MSEFVCHQMSRAGAPVICYQGYPRTGTGSFLASTNEGHCGCIAWQNDRCALVPEDKGRVEFWKKVAALWKERAEEMAVRFHTHLDKAGLTEQARWLRKEMEEW